MNSFHLLNNFSFNTHPKINKTLYDRNGLLQLKDISKGFPSSRPVGILKWNYYHLWSIARLFLNEY